MDIYCPHCGEPVDTDEFHNGTDSYSEIGRLFRKYGCPIADQAMDGVSGHVMLLRHCSSALTVSDDRIGEVRATYDLLGDDMDGASSILNEYM